MSTAAAPAAVTAITDPIAYGREVYRRAQRIDWPEGAAFTLVRLASRLWTETEVAARLRDDGCPGAAAGRTETICTAAQALVSAMRAWCGDDAAKFVSGEAARAAVRAGEES